MPDSVVFRTYRVLAARAQPESKSIRVTIPAFVADVLELKPDDTLVYVVDLVEATVTIKRGEPDPALTRKPRRKRKR